jgi:HSP20 family protein
MKMANITRYDPFNEIVDDLFKGFFVRPMGYNTARTGFGTELPQIKVDVTDSEAAYAVHAELAGVKKEDIQVQVDGNQLTLSAEVKRETEAKENGERLIHVERAYGKTSRSFTLPQEIDEAKVQAKFKDGVLELTLPKKQPAPRKQIEIH